jgi:hypothetical protein
VTLFLSLFSLPGLRLIHTILTTTSTLIRRDPHLGCAAVLDSRRDSWHALMLKSLSSSRALGVGSRLLQSSAATPPRPPQLQARSSVTFRSHRAGTFLSHVPQSPYLVRDSCSREFTSDPPNLHPSTAPLCLIPYSGAKSTHRQRS